MKNAPNTRKWAGKSNPKRMRTLAKTLCATLCKAACFYKAWPPTEQHKKAQRWTRGGPAGVPLKYRLLAVAEDADAGREVAENRHPAIAGRLDPTRLDTLMAPPVGPKIAGRVEIGEFRPDLALQPAGDALAAVRLGDDVVEPHAEAGIDIVHRRTAAEIDEGRKFQRRHRRTADGGDDFGMRSKPRYFGEQEEGHRRIIPAGLGVGDGIEGQHHAEIEVMRQGNQPGGPVAVPYHVSAGLHDRLRRISADHRQSRARSQAKTPQRQRKRASGSTGGPRPTALETVGASDLL